MVLPGDELTVRLRHIGMRDGNIVVNIETSNARGEKVIQGSAEVSQSSTVYVFTGQGSQEPGMGMDLYMISSPAARASAVWEGADAHLLAVYGFSIVEFVKDNPKKKQHQRSGNSTMEMTYGTMDKDGHVKTLVLILLTRTLLILRLSTPSRMSWRFSTRLLVVVVQCNNNLNLKQIMTRMNAESRLGVSATQTRTLALPGHRRVLLVVTMLYLILISIMYLKC